MKRSRRPPVVLLGALIATAYFVAHTVFGTHGLLARERLIERSGNLEREIAVLEAVRIRLLQDVAALTSEPPHPDIIEAAARATLGLVRPGDLVVVKSTAPSPR